MFDRISIIGDGAMGTAMAMLLCEKGRQVRMWGHDREQLEQIKKAGENFKFLPGYKLPDTLVFEPDEKRIFENCELAVSAAPCQFMRSAWKRLKQYFNTSTPIVSVTKGIENGTLLRPDEILRDVLGEVKCAALSGPTIADELARKLPATACAACEDE